VLPVVAEIVEIGELGGRMPDDLLKLQLLRISAWSTTLASRRPVRHAVDAEAMEVGVLPPQHDLQDAMQ